MPSPARSVEYISFLEVAILFSAPFLFLAITLGRELLFAPREISVWGHWTHSNTRTP